MTITSAILEFLVLGCLWSCGFLAATFILVGGSSGSWPQVNLEGAEVVVTLLGIPVIYAIGVILQAATWRFWYKEVHRKALQREIEGSHSDVYHNLAKDLNMTLETGKDLGRLLDVLRWKLLGAAQSESAQQYLIQFHLYRVLYGSIPPFIFLGVILALGTRVASRMGSWSLALTFSITAIFSILLAAVAFTGADHRRSRTWKHLVFAVHAKRPPLT
jgi:hypothetical protein